jgi:hypothetical protein
MEELEMNDGEVVMSVSLPFPQLNEGENKIRQVF